MSTNDPQHQMIQAAMKAIAERKPGRTKLVYDKTKRTIVAVAEGSQVPRALNITADDADMFALVTISTRWLRDQWPQMTCGAEVATQFTSWDNGDAFTDRNLGALAGSSIVNGTVALDGKMRTPEPSHLRITLAPIGHGSAAASSFLAPDGSHYQATAQRQINGHYESLNVILADVQPALAERRASILETSILSDKSVLCIGLGTGGAYAAIELAKCGVGKFTLLDRDRLAVGNVIRHPGGISQVGRFKVNVVRDLIHEKNPDAQVATHPVELTYENREALEKLIEEVDVVICGTDNRPSKLLINQLCVQANVVAVYGGAFRRAYGGQVLRVRPKRSPCHQCFVAAMPEESSDVEISSASDASDIAYSDRPVAVEPGLSLDVSPIANMVTKLALLELLSDKQTSLDVLNRDYDAPWYLWLNRPEPGTPYANWPPLSESSDEMTINRWYGIYFDRDAACPICGDFVSSIAASYGLNTESLVAIPAAPTRE